VLHSQNQQIYRKYTIFHYLQNVFAGRMKWLHGPDLDSEP